jgi:ATP synthase protein I
MIEKPEPENRGKLPNASGDPELSARLEKLGRRLDQVRGGQADAQAANRTTRADNSGLAKAFRLSAEFVSGPIAGGLIGWGVDKLLHTKPWGLMIFLLLGFLAGIYNVMRTSGFLKKPEA